jgi:hypothetical protein
MSTPPGPLGPRRIRDVRLYHDPTPRTRLIARERCTTCDRVNPDHSEALDTWTAKEKLMTADGEHIVLGINGSPADELALEWAAHESAVTKHPLRVVYAYSGPTAYGPGPL